MVATDAGKLRIVKTDASETVRQVLFEAHSSRLNVGTDPRTQIILPMSAASAREDDKILIEYFTGTASIAGTGDCTYVIPMRKRNVRTGNVADSVLTVSDVDLGADVTIPANRWTVIAAYTVNAQEEVKLGQSIAENSRIYIDLVE
jgi:hypothetical protein